MASMSLRWVSLAATLCLIAVPAISSAAGRAVRSMPAGYFDERDLSLMQDAVVGVLEDESPTVTRSWNNSKNGHSGKVTALRAFKTADGRPCKQLQIDNSAEGYKSSTRYDICLHQDGNWREAESGVPFGKASSPKDSP